MELKREGEKDENTGKLTMKDLKMQDTLDLEEFRLQVEGMDSTGTEFQSPSVRERNC